MLRFMLGLIVTIVLPLILIKFFVHNDDDIGQDIKLSRKDIVLIIICGILSTLLINLIMQPERLNLYINTVIMTAYLIFMSYTDRKTTLLYTSVSLFMMVVETIFFIGNTECIEYVESSLLVILLVLFIMVLFIINGALGMGDMYIYIVIAMYLIQYTPDAAMIFIINVFMTNLLMVVTFLHKISKGLSATAKLPMASYIYIVTLVLNIMIIR